MSDPDPGSPAPCNASIGGGGGMGGRPPPITLPCGSRSSTSASFDDSSSRQSTFVPDTPMPSNQSFAFATLSPGKQVQRSQDEYMKLYSVDASLLKANDFKTAKQFRKLNRYSDILANEKTLFPPSEACIGYLNANWIVTSGAPAQPFVASQAPVPECFAAFWHSIYQYKIELLFMLTNDFERGIPKADRYWPKRESETEEHKSSSQGTPSFAVTLVEEHRDEEKKLIVRKLRLVPIEATKKGGEGKPHEVRQIQYLGWPDHGVPSSTVSFQYMVHEIALHEDRHNASSSRGSSPAAPSPTTASRGVYEVPPILVHCSAGVGRTGTLIAVYAVLRRLRDVGRWLSDSAVFDTVRELKLGRYGMVQRAEQYHFIYMCIVEEFLKLPPK